MANHAISQPIAALSGAIPGQPGPSAPLLPTAQHGYRLVPAAIGRPGNVQTAWIQCPTAWCVTDHSEPVMHLEDVHHYGERRSVSFGDGVPVAVHLAQWPGSHDIDAPHLAVDTDCEVTAYGRTAALALADQLVAFAEDVRRLAESLPDDTPTAGRSQADETPRRIREGGVA